MVLTEEGVVTPFSLKENGLLHFFRGHGITETSQRRDSTMHFSSSTHAQEHPISSTLLVAAFTCVFSSTFHAQAFSTASKSNSIDLFGGYTNANPGFGDKRDMGATFGFDFTHYFKHLPVAPSFEARSTFINGAIANERTYLFGVKAETHIGNRFHPYGGFLIGPGNIHFNQQSASSFFLIGDNSTVMSLGGGVDIDLRTRWQAKVDYQWQRWDAGSLQHYHPSGVTFGVTYHFPFKPFNSHK